MSLKSRAIAAPARGMAGRVPLALIAAALLSGPAAAVDANLVTMRIDTSQRATLAGQRVEWAGTANDRGSVAATRALSSLRLGLKRTPERQRAFDAYLRELQDPASPNYQQWLTPGEVGERFGASDADIEAIAHWLRDQGLTVESVSNSRMSLRFSGTAAAVGAAFDTELHWYETADRKKRMAPARDPRIPAALADAVEGVLGLSEVRFEPLGRIGRLDSLPANDARPALTNCRDGECAYFVTPGDFAKIYNLDGPKTQGLDGRGQTIAVLGRARVHNGDIQAFGERMAVTMKTPKVIIADGGVDPGPAATTCGTAGSPSCDDPNELLGDQGEATLDVTRAGSVAPGADIKLVISGTNDNVDGLIHALIHAIDHQPLEARIISISFGSCEAGNSQALADALDDAFAQAAMQGQSVFVSSGDAGAADCAKYFTTPDPDLSRSTNVFCSSGHVTCVGGTSFGLGTANAQYWASSSSPSNGYVSAKGYIPEGAWNEPLDHDGKPYVASTGGGVSVYIRKPSWQTGPGVPGSQGRYVPDVSFGASTLNGYFGCMAASQGSCVPGADNMFHFVVWGGTSASAPSMAGIAAMLNQKAGSAQGNLNPTLYALGANRGNGVYHDITVQSSGVTNCSVDVASLCNNSLPGPNGLSGGAKGYVVGPGYDLATGLGSIDVAKLFANWGASSGINPNQQGITGAWADLSTSSQGIVMEAFPSIGQMFGGWFTFDATAAGGQRWYTIQGDVNAASPTSDLQIYRFTGGRFDSAQASTPTAVGAAQLRFNDCAHASLDYLFSDGSGRSGTLDLTRISASTACSASGDVDAGGSQHLFSGTWADPSNNAQGLVLDISPAQNSFFAAWYTFNNNGASGSNASSQRWFTLQTTMPSGARQLSGIQIYVSSGGVFDQQSDTTMKQIGSADLRFLSCSRATLNYRFQSGSGYPASGTLDLSRVGPVPAGCTF